MMVTTTIKGLGVSRTYVHVPKPKSEVDFLLVDDLVMLCDLLDEREMLTPRLLWLLSRSDKDRAFRFAIKLRLVQYSGICC